MNLQILLGRDRGRVIALPGGTYVVGRSSECNVVLVSDIVSRKHAQIMVGATDLRVTDLGSSNGTYINGARVLGEGVANQGDVLLVGEVALRLHAGQVPTLLINNVNLGGPNPGTVPPPTPDGSPPPLTNMNGNLTEVPPSTLLRHLAVIKKTGVLLLTSPPLQGRITFTRGHISEVLVETRKTRDPVQALTAILRWRGTYELGQATDTSASLLLGLDVVLPAVGSGARPSIFPKPIK